MRKVFLFSCLALSALCAAAQVNIPTGSAIVNIPIQSWQDTKSRLSANIELQYSSKSGLKTDEMASNVGQGWNLTASGIVVRMQVGQPDDQKPKDGLYTDVTKYPPGYLYNSAPISSGCPTALHNYPIFGSSNVVYKNDNVTDADREQDFFVFSFNGRNGVMVLGKRGSDPNNPSGGRAVFLGDVKLKATYDIDETAAATQHLRTTVSAFHIQDENGLIYTFRDKGLTRILKTHSASMSTDYYGNPYASQAGSPSSYDAWTTYYEADFNELQDADNPYIVGSWYLSEIKDPLTTRTITYTYHTETLNNFAGTSIRGTSRPYVIVSAKFSITQTPVLDQVTYPDGVTASMIYGASRFDLQGDKQLTGVKLTFQGRTAYRFDFVQSYMVKSQIRLPTDNTEYRLSRLCLTGVKRWGADDNGQQNVYSFAYNTGTDETENCVPPPFCEVTDIWGYYNGDKHSSFDNSNGHTTIPSPFAYIGGRTFYEYETLAYLYANIHPKPNPDPMVKPGYAALGLLTGITYPGGGTLTYTYAQNTGLFPGDAAESNCAGVHVAQTVAHDGGTATAADIVTNYSFTMPNNSSSIWGLEKAINLRQSTSSFYPESQYVTVLGCDYDYKYPGILSVDQATSLSDMQQAMAIFSKILGYAGLAMDIFQVVATAGDNPVFAIVELVWDVLTNFVTSCNQHTESNTDLLYYNRDLNAGNSLPIQFKRAVVTQGSSGTPNGQTIYEYTSPDVPGVPGVLVADNTASYSQRQRALSWVYGLPRMTTLLDAAGNTVKQIETDYDLSAATTQRTIDDGTGTTSAGGCTCAVNNMHSRGSDTWTSTGYINTYETQTTADMAIQPYVLYTGRAPVTDVYERTFRDANNKLETHTHYDYDSKNYLPQKVTTTQSNGDQSIKEMYYAPDYTAGGVFQTMTNNNLVNTPVATYNSVVKNQLCHDCPPSQPVYLGATVYNYSVQGNGDIKADKGYTSWSRVANQLSGVGNFGFDAANPLNYPNLVQTEALGYDATTGNLVRQADEGGRVITSLYDYDDRFVVAQVYNADPNVDKSAYSSFESTGTGAWTLGGTNTWQSTNAITGAAGFDLGGRTLTASFAVGKPYILSFWAYSGASVSVSGGTLVKTGPTYKNFTYYEYSLSSGSPVVSGSGVIDELRLYPARARMTSYTYDPVLGKTSECDMNNRIHYFEYDPAGRLHIVRDEQSNIIKMIEYNYKH
ncbi:hypothetical protein [Puia sp.]|uniref:hypothetical protein n=1 Tax=Puia sp. TaxID=2045100 RepID=UPI002F401EFC